MQHSEAEAAQRSRAHILVINSDPEIQKLVWELLTDERYNVTTTNYVNETFEMIVALYPSLLIADLVFGERAGWDLLERLTRTIATRGIPVILTSTNPYLLEKTALDPARYGTTKELILPFNIDDLLRAVSELIGSA